jgi:hypothetical protein
MSITRDEVIRRAATVWPLGHVPYSQTTVRNPGTGSHPSTSSPATPSGFPHHEI